MALTRLIERRVEKVWGRRDLPAPFAAVAEDAEPVGEIWFEDPRHRHLLLLVKYLFTSDKLSIQVHPGDEAARRAGHPHGKDEAWLVLEAEPGATIGLGLKERIGKEALRSAALDGSIEQLLDWRPVAAGDFLHSPAGTVHAIGPGVSLIEIQQNVDLTYRLYDYGRPRELHLDEAIEAADPRPCEPGTKAGALDDRREMLVESAAFIVEGWRGPTEAALEPAAEPAWLIPIEGAATADRQRLDPGSVWLAEGLVELRLEEGAELLVAYPGPPRRSSPVSLRA